MSLIGRLETAEFPELEGMKGVEGIKGVVVNYFARCVAFVSTLVSL